MKLMRIGSKVLVAVTCALMSVFFAGCTDTPIAVQVFDEFRAAVKAEDYSKAYDMLHDSSRQPNTVKDAAHLEKLCKSEALKGVFSDDARLKSPRLEGLNSDQTIGDIKLVDETGYAYRTVGRFEAFKVGGNWKIRWTFPISFGDEPAASETPAPTPAASGDGAGTSTPAESSGSGG